VTPPDERDPRLLQEARVASFVEVPVGLATGQGTQQRYADPVTARSLVTSEVV
jgi:hypothetical protein